MNSRIPILALVSALWAGTAAAAPPSGGAYVLSRSALAAGGNAGATGGSYQLAGTLGQLDAASQSGGPYQLAGGFWGIARSTVDAGPEEPAPRVFAVRLAGANPFRAQTGFAIDLPAPRRLQVVLFSVDGRLVRSLFDSDRAAGRHLVLWDGKDGAGRSVPPGVYLARIQAGTDRANQRIVRLD
jgi:hypothetical protein